MEELALYSGHEKFYKNVAKRKRRQKGESEKKVIVKNMAVASAVM